MIRLGKRDAMIIVCGNNRLRLYKYELHPDYEKLADFLKDYEIKKLIAFQRRCAKIIKVFMKAAI